MAEHSITTMCRVLEVSRSGFHAWAARRPSARAVEDAQLLERIAAIHRANRGVYGSPRVHTELVLAEGERLGRKRVERLMAAAGLSGLQRRRRGKTTVRMPGVRVCEDLVDRVFLASAPDRLWLPTTPISGAGRGWLYLVAVQDVFSRRIIGWPMDSHMRTELVLDALEMALAQRRPAPVPFGSSSWGSERK